MKPRCKEFRNKLLLHIAVDRFKVEYVDEDYRVASSRNTPANGSFVMMWRDEGGNLALRWVFTPRAKYVSKDQEVCTWRMTDKKVRSISTMSMR
eukprot:scaffold684_cov345-Pavlova_lutheri.AAC.16